MRARLGWKAALVLGAALGAAAPTLPAGALLDWLFPTHEVQVITSTDIMPAGTLLRAPSPADPVYYVAKNFGYRDFGKPMPGDKLPKPQDMMRTIFRALAQAGYLPADARHPPSQLIIFAWGTLYRNLVPRPNLPDEQINYSQMLLFLGGDKFGLVSEFPDEWGQTLPGFTRIHGDARAISNVAAEDLYVAALAGYEFPIRHPKHPTLLWRTKISCPAAGLAMADTLPPMLVIAEPYIGHPMSRPVWVSASDKFKPEVHIGNPKVEEYLDTTPVPVIEKEAAPPKGGRSGK